MGITDTYFDLDAIVDEKFDKEEKEIYETVCAHFADQERQLMELEQNIGVRFMVQLENRLRNLEKAAANPVYVPPPVYGPIPPTPPNISKELNLLLDSMKDAVFGTDGKEDDIT